MSVSPRTRFSAIHCRSWSRFTGPYCRPSAPMILYIAPFSLNEGAAESKFFHYIFGGKFVIRGGMLPGGGGSGVLAWRTRLMLVSSDHSQEAAKNRAPAK